MEMNNCFAIYTHVITKTNEKKAIEGQFSVLLNACVVNLVGGW